MTNENTNLIEKLEMIDIFLLIVHALTMWGLLVGLVVAAILAYAISIYLWGEFRVELFIGLAFPFVIAGLFIQHKVEKPNENEST